MKKDGSQIGINARKAVKFLDRMTSDKLDLPVDPVVLQGPDEQYATWAEVEKYLLPEKAASESELDGVDYENTATATPQASGVIEQNDDKTPDSAGGVLSQMLLAKLNFAKDVKAGSPASTPPTSPLSSGPQSSKTSPDVKSATLHAHDKSVTPPALKPLINSVVWFTNERKVTSPTSGTSGLLFLTNAADTAELARSFGIMPKNIHQLRVAISLEDQEVKNHDKYQRKHPTPPSKAVPEPDPRPLFKFEDDSDEEVVVFKPRARGNRSNASGRGGAGPIVRSRNGPTRTSDPGFNTPAPAPANKPQVPTDEIDPDSFDRGGFARGSTPLANVGNVGNHGQNFHSPSTRNQPHRGQSMPAGPSRGGFRGTSRGLERSSGRGRGRLFVP